MFDEIVIVVLTAAATSALWFIQRWFTRAGSDELIARTSSVLSLHTKLKATGMSDNEAITFLSDLGIEQVALEKFVRRGKSNYNAKNSPLHTTGAIGAQLDARAQTLDHEIAELILKLTILASDPEYSTALEKAQKAWKKYQEAESRAAYEEYRHGTIRSSSSLSTSIELAELRIAYLKDKIAYKEAL